MQRVQLKTKRMLLAALIAAAAFLWWCRPLFWLAARQLLLGMLTALAALPLMKALEKHLPRSASAAVAIGTLNVAAAAALFWFLPILVRHTRQLFSLLPVMLREAATWSQRMQAWLARHGAYGLDAAAQTALLSRGRDALASALPALLGRLRGMAGGFGQWLLAPVFGYYFLRDRRMISAWLLTLLPMRWREPAVRMLREMRLETAAYLRGQLMVSGIVCALASLALLLCGVPAWLALGIAMGILELIPYIGPLAGGLLAVLFALPLGIWRTLWTLGAVVVVQQIEGSFLSPKLISQATRLHPAAVLLCVLLGGSAAGVAGILFSVPLVLCLRAALRVLVLYIPVKS